MTDSEIKLHTDAANRNREDAENDFREAALTAAGFAAATLIAREVVEFILPESKFREEVSSRVITLGLATTGIVFGAGSIAASLSRYQELQELRIVAELKKS